MPPIIETSPPPATASRSHPPPQAAGGKNSFIPLIFSFPSFSSIPISSFHPRPFPFPPLLPSPSSFPFPPSFPFPRKRESLPASAGNSAKRKCNVACGDAWRTMPPREIPAFAGMEEGAGMGSMLIFVVRALFLFSPLTIPPFPSPPPPLSIPAKAGISSRVSGKFREAEVQCRLRRCVADDAAPRDSRFRGNGRRGGNGDMGGDGRKGMRVRTQNFHSRESGNLFPRQREIPRSGSAMSPAAMRGGRCRPARFPLSREWKEGGNGDIGGMEERE